MPAPYSDRWDRRRQYLLRNFVVNPGLSPIPEEERSSPSSDSGSLPDLVVESVPDRHDHPPDFYVGLEHRMRRCYRKLFLGARSDDDSSDFEVNRSMGRTSMLDDYTRKDTEANVVTEKNSTDSDLDHSIAEKRRSTKSTNESHDDKRIDDEESPTLMESTKESNHSYKTDDDLIVNIEVNGNKQDDTQGSTNGDKVNSRRALNKTEDVSKMTETKSDSDEAPCHRVSTTVAEIHERRARDSTHVFDNGSPVLIPRLLQFSRSVFGSRRISGQSFNVSEASDEFIRRLSSHKSAVSNNQEEDIQEPETEVERLITDSQLTRASLDSDKTHDSEKVVEYIDNEENNQEDDATKDYDIGDKDLSKIQSENEGSKNDTDVDEETEITGIQNTSIDWNKDGIDDDEDCIDNALRRGFFTSKARKMVFISSSEESLDYLQPLAQSSAMSIDEVEVMRETRGCGVNESWHGEVDLDSPAALPFERQTDADKLGNESSDSTEINASIEDEIEEPNGPHDTPQNIAKIINEFWSVSPMEVDIEEGKEKSRGSKRRTDSEGDATAKRKKKDVAIQTGLEEQKKWEDIRKEFFVGPPLVFRLCGCPDHVCS